MTILFKRNTLKPNLFNGQGDNVQKVHTVQAV